MKIKQFFLILALTSMATTNVKAQWSLGFGYAHTIPLFNMCEKGYRDGGGYSLSILSKPFPNYYNWQIQMGGNLNHFWAGKEKQEIELAEPANASASYKIRNRHTAISFKTRLISKPNPVRFHADLDLGYRGFATREALYLNEYDSLYGSYDTTWATGGNLFAGITLGTMFRISENFYLDLYSRLDYGMNSRWYELDKNSIYDIYQYEKYPHQRTHAPLLWIGFTASFNIKSNGGGSTTKTTKSAPSSGGGSYTRPSSTTTPSINRSNPRPTPKPKAKPQVKPKPTPSSGGPR